MKTRQGFIVSLTLLGFAILNFSGGLRAADYEPKPDDPYFLKFNPRKAPEPVAFLQNQRRDGRGLYIA